MELPGEFRAYFRGSLFHVQEVISNAGNRAQAMQKILHHNQRLLG
jgi:hypothetical protein